VRDAPRNVVEYQAWFEAKVQTALNDPRSALSEKAWEAVRTSKLAVPSLPRGQARIVGSLGLVVQQSHMVIWALVLCNWVGIARAGQFDVRSMNLTGKSAQGSVNDGINVPYVQAPPGASAQTQAAARKINDRLFIEQTGVLAPRQYSAKFKADGMAELAATISEDFATPRNDARVLTISLDREGCGAYCENYTSYYQFDAQTGRLLGNSDLFTKAGRVELTKRMRKERLTQYRQRIAVLTREIKALRRKESKNSKEEADDLQDRLEFNQACINKILATNESEAELAQLVNYVNFALLPRKLRIVAGRCSNHAMQALDDVANVKMDLPYATLEPHLTDYGKNLLLGQGSAAPQESVYDQLLRGTLGDGAAVTMLLRKDKDDRVYGTYYYDKFGAPISLSGTVKAQVMVLNEFDPPPINEEPKPVATLRLVHSGAQLEGVWTRLKDDKTQKVLLAP
jgi:hypothetical protein